MFSLTGAEGGCPSRYSVCGDARTGEIRSAICFDVAS